MTVKHASIGARHEDWGNVRVILGLYRDNAKENGNYKNGLHRV